MRPLDVVGPGISPRDVIWKTALLSVQNVELPACTGADTRQLNELAIRAKKATEFFIYTLCTTTSERRLNKLVKDINSNETVKYAVLVITTVFQRIRCGALLYCGSTS